MKVNESKILVSKRLALVPYCKGHVEKYHKWMQDKEIQKLTASEPLSLDEEYQMQESWQSDCDKLTFIIVALEDCIHKSKIDDIYWQVMHMIGDVNMFLQQHKYEENIVKLDGEIEIMIAEKSARKQKLGSEALNLFIDYIESNAAAIIKEYKANKQLQAGKTSKYVLNQLIAKINADNLVSLRLFQSAGFVQVGKSEYFNHIEIARPIQNA